jgi:hypothetical protein
VPDYATEGASGGIHTGLCATLIGIGLAPTIWRSLSPRARRLTGRWLLAASLRGNAAFIVNHVAWSIVSVEGGGQFEGSPDDKYTAFAHSRRPVPNYRHEPTYYVFSIESEDGSTVKSVRIDSAENNDSMYFRSLPKIIRWSEDSKEAIFTIPGVELRMDREIHNAS